MKVKILLFSVLLCIVSSIQLSAQVSSGIIAGGGIGNMDTKYQKFIPANKTGAKYEGDYNYDLYLGYRFRIQQAATPFFYDLDARFGTMSITDVSYMGVSKTSIQEKDMGNNQKYYFAIGTMANVKVFKGLSAGIGLEPTYYFAQQHRNKYSPRFDIPVVARIGYDFGNFEVSLSAKYGLIRNSLKGVLDSNRREALMLSVYIPIFR